MLRKVLAVAAHNHSCAIGYGNANPAKDLPSPRNIKPNEVTPYTPKEENVILTACDHIGGGKYNRSGARYEQLRARAMVLLLRHTALRISDVATLGKDRVSWDSEGTIWRVLVYTQKTGECSGSGPALTDFATRTSARRLLHDVDHIPPRLGNYHPTRGAPIHGVASSRTRLFRSITIGSLVTAYP